MAENTKLLLIKMLLCTKKIVICKIVNKSRFVIKSLKGVTKSRLHCISDDLPGFAANDHKIVCFDFHISAEQLKILTC